MSRRVLVFGGRDFHDRKTMTTVLNNHLRKGDIVIWGCAPGADALAGDVAGRVLGFETDPHPADWFRYGRGAGPIRNQEMLDSGVDFAIEFPGGYGTQNMHDKLVSAGVEIAQF